MPPRVARPIVTTKETSTRTCADQAHLPRVLERRGATAQRLRDCVMSAFSPTSNRLTSTMSNKEPTRLNDRDSGSESERPQDFRVIMWMVLLLTFAMWVFRDTLFQGRYRTIPYSEFKGYVAEKLVTDLQIHESEIFGTMKEPMERQQTVTDSTAPSTQKRSSARRTRSASDSPSRFRTVRVDDPELIGELKESGIEYTGVPPGIGFGGVFSWLLIIGLLLLFWRLLSMRLPTSAGMMSIGNSRAKLVADDDTGVDFADVAGCDEAKFELQEVVDFLQNPKRYTQLGAKIPKGVLLVGPPGTGKTLLARAVAGEAMVPFYSLSGSDFVELFVGVGAARVRDLFQQAMKNSPCIIFIDELDAIGRQRTVHVGSVNDEREHTLNQLLVELDGFKANVGVIVLAATNRPDVLDRALLRPGRFDRQVVLDAPDLEGRKAILGVHARNKPLDDDVNLETVAAATPGFSGADLANVMNEAALLSARKQDPTISQSTVEEAVEKVVAGPERKSRRLEPSEKERVAYHEVGHALVGIYSDHADPVHKISIVPPRPRRTWIHAAIADGGSLLDDALGTERSDEGATGRPGGGGTSIGEVSTGAENDLQRATVMARQMVCMYGMGDSIGLTHCAGNVAFDPNNNGHRKLDCSPATAEKIDEEVKKLLDQAYDQAKQILTDHRDELDRVADVLLEHETIDAKALRRLVNDHEVARSPRMAHTRRGN